MQGLYMISKSAVDKKIFRKAVNLLQLTSWKINEELLSVMKHFHNSDSDGSERYKGIYKQGAYLPDAQEI